MNKTVIVTGGRGFLGSHVVRLLRDAGIVPYVVRSDYFDLTNLNHVNDLFGRFTHIDSVYHLAARVGGIQANLDNGAKFYHDNILMDTHVLSACADFKVGKVILVGSNCSYPRHAEVPFIEEDLFSGYPEESNAAYGIAKRSMLSYYQALWDQKDLRGVYLVLGNLYGPGDHTGVDAHVIPSMVEKFRVAKANGDSHVILWGTGSATRDFLHVQDAAEALLMADARYEGREPINLSSGEEVSIAELADKIARAVGYVGHIAWDVSRSDGHPRRVMDTRRAFRAFGWKPTLMLDDGLRTL